MYVHVCMYNAAFPTCPYSLSPSFSIITAISSCHYSLSSCVSKMVVSSSVCLSADDAEVSSVTFTSSIVAAVVFSTVISSLATYLTTYLCCIKGNHCRSLNEVNGYEEQETSQQVVVYEEVGTTDQLCRYGTESINTTSNVAYGKM